MKSHFIYTAGEREAAYGIKYYFMISMDHIALYYTVILYTVRQSAILKVTV
jgi:hypothetical protein